MRRIFSFFFIAILLLSLTACGKNIDEPVGESTSGQSEQNANEETTGNNMEVTDKYIGVYYIEGSSRDSAYIITENGTVEDLGEIFGYVKYTSDGEYVIWKENESTLCIKQPGKAASTLLNNADSFVLNENTGMLIAFTNEGLYISDDLSQGIKKVKDMDGKSSSASGSNAFSNDGKHFVYLDQTSTLHLLNLADFSDKVVAENVDGSDPIVCISATEIYYQTNDNDNYLWNGTSSAKTEVNFTNTWSFRNKHIEGAIKIGNTGHVSPNHQYAVLYESSEYYKYKIADGSFIEKTKVGSEYSTPVIMDDGTVLFIHFGDGLTVVSKGTTKSLSGKILGGYYQNDVPYADGVLYYTEDSTLKAYNVNNGTTETIAEDVFSYQVKNGKVFYITNSKDLYLAGSTEKVATNVLYGHGAGFIH